MSIEKSYDQWAESYDSMSNKTRDLDLVATKANLGSRFFESVLEIGCGTGKNTEWLSLTCSRLVAVDFSEAMMALAKKKVSDRNVEFVRFNITEPWPNLGTGFDVITLNLVLEHIKDLSFVFRAAASRLASSGIIHLSELHPFRQYLGSKAHFETEKGTQELEVYTHHVSDFCKSLADAGLKVLELNEWFDDGKFGLPRLLTIIAANNNC
ncbi:MAG: class I SAM-dependent methyltransferase [Pirellulales bacterium]